MASTKKKRKKSTHRRTKKQMPQFNFKSSVIAIVFIILILFSWLRFGIIGTAIDTTIRYLIGIAVIPVYLLLIITAILFGINFNRTINSARSLTGALFICIAIPVLLQCYYGEITEYTWYEIYYSSINNNMINNMGGFIGLYIYLFGKNLIAVPGLIIVSLLLLIIGVTFILNKKVSHLADWLLYKIVDIAKSTFVKTQTTHQKLKEAGQQKKEAKEIEISVEEDIKTVAQPSVFEKIKNKFSDLFLETVETSESTKAEKPLEYLYQEEPTIDLGEPQYEPPRRNRRPPRTNETPPKPILPKNTQQKYYDEAHFSEEDLKDIKVETAEHYNENSQPKKVKVGFFDQLKANDNYRLPSYDLLANPVKIRSNIEDTVKQKGKLLEATLRNFGVDAKVSHIRVGPAVTQYEIQPAIGVKVSKVVNLNNDIALALAAKDIRIEAPIPGKSAIGIEVPNDKIKMVTLKEVLEFGNNQPENKLLVAFGKNISGEPVLAELNKMPHLLVAGSTGSGKSVCINGIIVSLLMRAKPHEVKMLMIDPKMVELSMYNGIPHLLTPVVTNPHKAANALQKIVLEMERRYKLFSESSTRNIEGYNKYVQRYNKENKSEEPLAKMPYIVVIVDELADLMVVASKDVEENIMRLAQMARAAGIHLIIATQRPSVDVITGIIKANIPSRVAFAVSSATDSRTILDMSGAEKLLGRGDMLFAPYGSNKPVRVQGAFLSDEEVENIVDFVKREQEVEYDPNMTPSDEPSNSVGQSSSTDALYEDVLYFVRQQQKASASLLQRRFKIGYNRAARIIDELEADGVIGPQDGSKPRQVYLDKYE